MTLDELRRTVHEFRCSYESHDRLEAAADLMQFARDYIAREQLLDTPLTLELCAKLGMVKNEYRDTLMLDIGDSKVTGEQISFSTQFTPCLDWGEICVYNPTIRHLLAAACLAGVTVDLSRLSD